MEVPLRPATPRPGGLAHRIWHGGDGVGAVPMVAAKFYLLVPELVTSPVSRWFVAGVGACEAEIGFTCAMVRLAHAPSPRCRKSSLRA